MAKVTSMKNKLYKGAVIGLISLSAFPLLAAAQVTYPSYSYPSSSSCIALTAYQQIGSTDYRTGGQVTMLQQFLNRTSYLNGVTGLFDIGTYGAVVNYQRGHGITPTGTVGPMTRASINQQSCNGTSYSNQYGNQYNNGYHAAPAINSFSMSSAAAGTTVTLYGSNLAGNNSVVRVGASTVTASYSTDTALTFTVPYLSAGTYQVSVTNAYGTSNSMSFTILTTPYNNTNGNCALYGNSYQCGCATYNNGYSYSNNCNTNTNSVGNGTWFGTDSQPRISSISGQGTVSAGASNTWTASAYSVSNLPVTVRVDWGDGSTQVSSQGSGSSQSYPFTHSYSTTGQYTIRFTATDSNGAFAYSTTQVSVYGSSYSSNSYYTPSISSVSVAGTYRGSTVTVYGSNFSQNATITLSNSYGSYSYTSGTVINNGSALSFTVPYVTPGTYSLAVTNSTGQGSNSISFVVY